MRAALFGSLLAAATGACGSRVSSTTPPEVRYNQEGQEIGAEADAGALPLGPVPPGKEHLVVREEDGTCWIVETIECAPDERCSPPPALEVICP